MKRVYIQIIDPINGTCINACHEYPGEYNQAVEATLRYYNLSADELGYMCAHIVDLNVYK